MKKLFTLVLLCFLAMGGYSQAVQKVILTEFTGAWCGYCPDGALTMQTILAAQPNVIGVAIHNSDNMVTSNGNIIDNFYNSVGYPGGVANQKSGAVGRTSWNSAVNTALNDWPIASVSVDNVTYNDATRELSATVKATFTLGVSGNFRLNLWLVEDSVSGSGTGYNQTNYYNTTSGHPLYGAGNPIIGYQHRHVLRNMLGGAWGSPNTVTNTAQGAENSFTYSTTLTSGWNPEKMYLIGVLSKYDGSGITQRNIVNAEEIKLSEALAATSIEENTVFGGVKMYPNPFSERTTIQFDLEQTQTITAEIFDLNGKRVAVLAEGIMNAGKHTLNWDGRNLTGANAANGIYFVKISAENGQQYSGRISLQR